MPSAKQYAIIPIQNANQLQNTSSYEVVLSRFIGPESAQILETNGGIIPNFLEVESPKGGFTTFQKSNIELIDGSIIFESAKAYLTYLRANR